MSSLLVTGLLGLMGGIQSVLADSSSYHINSQCSNDALMRGYDQTSGLWVNPEDGNTYWWQSANMMTALNNLALQDSSIGDVYNYVYATTFANSAPYNPTPVSVQRTSSGALQKIYAYPSAEEIETRKQKQKKNNSSSKEKRTDVGFINQFYDDQGWWALAWLGARDVTGTVEYLNEAIDLWYNMRDGYGTHPCGGMPWNKTEGSSPNAITNELYIQLGAALANHVGDDQKDTYLSAAKEAWEWFKGTGMINSDNLINDGLDPITCENNGEPTWTYNQGVILGGLVELYTATGDESYLDSAVSIADAVTGEGSTFISGDGRGIFGDGCDWNLDCGGDGIQFKGVFPRNLAKLYEVRPSDQYLNFLETNARSIWENDYGDGCENGIYWGGPFQDVSPSSQSSALDCLTAALAVTGSVEKRQRKEDVVRRHVAGGRRWEA